MKAPARLEESCAETATGWWEIHRRRPEQRLAPLVLSLCGYREQSRLMVERRAPAVSFIPIILSFGEMLEIDMAGEIGQRFESFVSGLHPGHAITRYQGAQFGIQVNLTPLGAYRIFGAPGSELAHRIVDLGAIAPALGGSLADRLASTASWPCRLALVEELLASMAANGPEPDPMITWQLLWLVAALPVPAYAR